MLLFKQGAYYEKNQQHP